MALTWLMLQLILPIPKNLAEQTIAFWKPRLRSERIGALFSASHVVNWLWPVKNKKNTKWSWHTSSSFALWFMEKLKCWLQNIGPFPEPDQRLSRGQFFLRNAAVKTKTPSRAGSFDHFLESKKPKQQTAVVWFPRVTVMCSLQTKNQKPKYDKLHRLVIGLCMNHFAWNLDDFMLQGKARAAYWLPFIKKKQQKKQQRCCSLTDSKCMRHRGRVPLPLHVSLRRVRTSLLHLFKQWALADWDNICFIARDVICHTGEAGGDESRLVWRRPCVTGLAG